MIRLITPLADDTVRKLQIRDRILVSGYILCGRDAVLPRLSKMEYEDIKKDYHIELEGSAVFHTAVSQAGIGPTSSNKLEIESSIAPLSEKGVRLHLGKGMLRQETIELLDQYGSVFAVVPPVTAILKSRTIEVKPVAFEEEGMEALFMLHINEIPAVVAAAHGASVFR